MNGAVLVAAVCALVVFQGGYYAGAVCAVSFASVAVLAVLGRAKMRPGVSAAFLAAIGAVYLASAIAHGAALGMLQEAATWLALAGLAVWCSFDPGPGKDRTLDCLATAGAVLAAAGILMYAGVLPVEGAVASGRLMFTFQYANTAGLFFAVVAVLCLRAGTWRRRTLAALPAVALALTQSVGAIAVFVLALVALGIGWAAKAKPKLAVVAGTAAGAVAAVGIAAVALRGRAEQAIQTFVERIVQMADALGAIGASPLDGLGPDQWQYAYSSIQSAQYRAADVHCSYLQAGVDAGMVAVVLLAGLVAMSAVRLARRREWAAFTCAAMIAFHALFDFDFQFGAIVVLFTLLAADTGAEPAAAGRAGSGGEPAGDAGHDMRRMSRIAGWCAVALSLAASAGGIFLDMQAGDMRAAAASGDAGGARAALESSDVMRNDKLMQVIAVGTAYDAGLHEEAAELAAEVGSATENLDLYRAFSLYSLGRLDESRDVLADTLHRHPYNVELFESARQFIVDNEPGEAFARSYDAEAAQANSLAREGRAAWLSGQEEIELIGG